MDFEQEIAEMRRWFAGPRFAGIKRLYTAREVVEQRGTIRADYTVARDAAAGVPRPPARALRAARSASRRSARTRPARPWR